MNIAYLNEDGTEVSFLHAFADIEAMQLHWQGADERTQTAYQFIEPMAFEIYGWPGEQILEGMRGEATGGVTLTVMPEFVTGFLRLAPT
jgi:hypothetical protein